MFTNLNHVISTQSQSFALPCIKLVRTHTFYFYLYSNFSLMSNMYSLNNVGPITEQVRCCCCYCYCCIICDLDINGIITDARSFLLFISVLVQEDLRLVTS